MNYKCSYCGELGHNRRTCSRLAQDRMSGNASPNEIVAAEVASQVSADIAAPAESKFTVWEMVEKIVSQHRLVLLYGPPGTGKTTVANRNVREGQTVYNVTLTEETPAAELRGHYIPRGNEFVWQNGPALMAYVGGGRLVLNEIDKASGDALQFCNALCDDPEVSAYTLPTGETVRPHGDFSCVATMNGVPHDLPHALRDRFVVSICVDEIHPDAVKTLPKDLRGAARKGISWDEERSMSLRGWKAYAALRETIGEPMAAKAVFGDRADTIRNTIRIESQNFTA